jgi:phosphate transport system protein
MSSFVKDMLAKSLEAFDELDLAKAVAVIRMDRDLEEEFRSSLRRLSTFLMEDARSVGHVVEVVLCLRAIERIGGHAKNIGGYVVFLVKGKDVRHESLEAVEAEVMSDQTG